MVVILSVTGDQVLLKSEMLLLMEADIFSREMWSIRRFLHCKALILFLDFQFKENGLFGDG